jgi:ribosome-associated protein
VHLRFDIDASTLPDFYKTRLLAKRDRRIGADGIIVIKAQRYRSQEQNREDALQRLAELIRSVGRIPPTRKPTRPTLASKQRRLAHKSRRSRIKALRGKPGEE